MWWNRLLVVLFYYVISLAFALHNTVSVVQMNDRCSQVHCSIKSVLQSLPGDVLSGLCLCSLAVCGRCGTQEVAAWLFFSSIVILTASRAQNDSAKHSEALDVFPFTAFDAYLNKSVSARTELRKKQKQNHV